ncbi:MAG: amidohydrolase family protein [Candidatus Aminicenantes bacterium]|nr:MAG: amidohydrolase family protein [Candidatus Aminicenantes bacterium]
MIHLFKTLFSKKSEPGRNLDFKIIDAHVHIPSDRYLPHSFNAPIIDNLYSATIKYAPTIKRKTIEEKYKKNLSDHECDHLVEEMNEAGVEKTILLLPDFTFQLEDMQYDIDEMIAMHTRVLDKYPGRFYLFAGIDPRWNEKGLKIFCKYLEKRKIHGLKVYPPCGYYPNDELLKPYYELCSENKLPVIIHTGPTSPIFRSKFSEIRYIDEIAYEYPYVNFILAHGGVNNVDDAVLLCAFRPNVYLDISGFLASFDPSGPINALRALFKRKINHKIIFGTDWPILGLKNTYSNIVDKLKDPRNGAINSLTDLEKKMILRENILNLIGPAVN